VHELIITTIQFVRGIIVDGHNALVGEGALDEFDSQDDTERIIGIRRTQLQHQK